MSSDVSVESTASIILERQVEARKKQMESRAYEECYLMVCNGTSPPAFQNIVTPRSGSNGKLSKKLVRRW
jgi:hypothetical protein